MSESTEIEQLLSKAYFRLLTQLVDVFAEALPTQQLHRLLRRAGRALAHELIQQRTASGNLRSRATMVSEMMNEHLGAVSRVESNGGYAIRAVGCPLAALTGN